MGVLTEQPYGVKVLVVGVFGTLACALMQAAEFARQDYELAVCTTSTNQCLFNSANGGTMLAMGAVAVSSMGVAAAAAHAFAPPTFSHMKTAFVMQHFACVVFWYILSWSTTLVPLIYTICLLVSQANQGGANLYVADPATENQSQLLLSMGEDTPYNACNPNSIYCLSIVPGLLAGFGYLFAGATAFWCAWIVMDDTAHKVFRGEDVDDYNGVEGAYFSAVPQSEPEQPKGDGVHIAGMR